MEVFAEDCVAYVLHVQAERDLGPRKMGALTDAGQTRGEDLVPGCCQKWTDFTKSIGSTPRTMNQDDFCHKAKVTFRGGVNLVWFACAKLSRVYALAGSM